jgi:predicted transcriptional regulator
MAKTTSVRLDNETHQTVKGIAFISTLTMSEVIRDAVRHYVQASPSLQSRLALLDQAGLDDEPGNDE